MIRKFVIAPVIAMIALLALESCGNPDASTLASQKPKHTEKGIEAADVNSSADPCNDFHDYANGAWRAANPIPGSLPRWSRRSIARQQNRQQLQTILEEVSAKDNWPAGTPEQLVGDHFAACMNQPSIDSAGVAPLATLQREIDSVKNITDVQRMIRRLHDIAVPVVFSLTGTLDNDAPENFIANITAGGFGLPDRDHYIDTSTHFSDARRKYKSHIAAVFKLGGMADTKLTKAADVVFAFEKRLAEVSLDSAALADPAKTEHRTTFAQLEKLAPHVDWASYFSEAQLLRVDLNVADPAFLTQVDKELQSTSIADWRLYLTWRLLAFASPTLFEALANETFDFDEVYLKGTTAKPSRAATCVESTESMLGEPLGRKYVEVHFTPAAKARALNIARTVLEVLKEEVASVPWMEPETKKRALDKLNTYNPQIGYPDKWKDYSKVVIHRDTFWANVMAAQKFNVADNRSRIGKKSDRNLWQLPPSSPDAYLDLQLNEIVVPAGFLQPPTFNLSATDAVNYGAIGVGLAHDMTHSIDAGGAQLDPMGRPKNWWTDKDRAQFQSRAQCVVDQYEGYYIAPDVHHNGKLVQSEAIGDLAGVRLAYLALQKSMRTQPVPAVDGFTAEQQFFISMGQFRGDSMTLEAERKLVKADSHPTPRYRVNGPLSDSPEFQQAFACKSDAKMVKPPERRCSVW